MPLSSSAAAVGLATDAMRNLSISLSSYPSPAASATRDGGGVVDGIEGERNGGSVVHGIEGERNGGDGRYHFGIQLDLSIERERAFRKDVIKNKGRDRSIPFEQTLEILKYISNDGEAATKRLKESAMKVARYSPINTRSSTEFQQSPKELAFYRRGEIVERRAHSLPPLQFHDNDNNNGGLGPSISSMVTERLPKRSNLMETKRKSSKASDNASLLRQPHGSQPSLLQSVDLRCHICQVHCMSAFNLQEHFQGKKHQEKCRQHDQQWPPYEQLVALRCNVCHMTCSSTDDLHKHFQGKKHLEMCEEYDRKQPPNRQLINLHCDICDVTCPSEFHLYQHQHGAKHMSKCRDSCSAEENRIVWCDVCRISCPNMTSLMQHRWGKRHIMQLYAGRGSEVSTYDGEEEELEEGKPKRFKEWVSK